MVDIVTRAQWGARQPKSRHTIGLPTRDLWLHHFATDAWAGAAGMRACQAFHMDSRGWNDIAYSFCVDRDGLIFEGRGAGIQGGHTAGHNTTSHAISWMANTDANKPTRAMIESTARLAAHGQREGWWGGWTGGHREAKGAATACPGRHGMAALPDIRALTATYLNASPAVVPASTAPPIPDMENDMLIIQHPTGAAVGVSGGVILGIKEATTLEAFRKAGVPIVPVDNATWQTWHKAAR